MDDEDGNGLQLEKIGAAILQVSPCIWQKPNQLITFYSHFENSLGFLLAQGLYGSWKTWKVMEFWNFFF